MKGPRTIFALALSLYGFASVALAGTFIDLGTLGGNESGARAINNAGDIVGSSRNATDTQEDHPFLYSNGVMTDLGLRGTAYGINSAGQISGITDNSAFLYSGGSVTNPGSLGGSHSEAAGINSAGQIAGSSFGTGNNFEHAVVYSAGGGITDLGALEGGDTCQAIGINNAGQVVGYSYTITNSNTRGTVSIAGFLYTPGIGMTNIGSLGGGYTVAEAINDAGQIVGLSAPSGGLPLNSSSFQHAFLYSGGIMIDLGTFGGLNSTAMGINAVGQIVGTAQTANGEDHAFLYEGGVMTDLNSLLPRGSGWQLSVANGINDLGQIVGTGTNARGFQRAFLLDTRADCTSVPQGCRPAGAGRREIVEPVPEDEAAPSER